MSLPCLQPQELSLSSTVVSPKQAQRTTIWAGFSKHFPDVAIAEEELDLATEWSFINPQKIKGLIGGLVL